MKKNVYDYSRKSFEEYFLSIGSPKFRATQLFEALYKQRIRDFSEMTNFKKEFRAHLEENFAFGDLKVIREQVSGDGTRKYLFGLEDGIVIETVLMNHNYGKSVCITTQAGCNMGCLFCASGQTKKIRNLTTGEMVLQVLKIDEMLREEGERVSHVVIMGIGEPFDNFENVIEFIRVINDDKGLEIGARHITVSTCGIVPRIYEFADLGLQVNLAVSLHFPTDEERSKYMRINRRYGLEELFKALRYYYEKTNRRITFEYILLAGINDSLEDARLLCELVRGMNAYVNLIPYNETGIYKRSDEKTRRAFFDYLMKNGVNAIMRKEQGHDIDAACGQLRLKEMRCKED
ncbi:MAG TPA: 23S rRNA (adenine(2503)-C(2))-methyltransferase RlmN [Acholeplasmataceae bacterium]|nr:23S rRNA (adenine(2503)-C(2))-methyltransferase RlmN [Acholeplasmataceae bacterium]